MIKQLVSGEYCYVGNPECKVKRIWLGKFNAMHVCVSTGFEDRFKNEKEYRTSTWDICTPIEDEPPKTKIVYEWMARNTDGIYYLSSYLKTEEEAKEYFCGVQWYKKTGREFEVEV